jgi:hypothetical protein
MGMGIWRGRGSEDVGERKIEREDKNEDADDED